MSTQEPSGRAHSVFRLHELQGELRSDGAPVALEPKALELLAFLVARAGRIVTREELVEGVWGGLAVSKDAIRYAMKELRRGLGDSARAPAFIETVVRRGWRFVGRVARVSRDEWIIEPAPAERAVDADAARLDDSAFVGRDREMEELDGHAARARSGQRAAVFIRGEPGIGKSRLLDAFLESVKARPGVVVARGECIEHVGSGMPYAPLFEILEQLCECSGGEAGVEILRQHAPTWLAQMPSRVDPQEHQVLTESLQGATQTRMIREWAHAVDALAAERTIVIAIEDLHWADPSTILALLFAVARRDAASVLIVATLRPEARNASEIDLQAGLDEVARRGDGAVLSPSALEPAGVEAYLGARFGEGSEPQRSHALRTHLMSASAGNPLFLVSLVDDVVEKGLVRRRDDDWQIVEPLRVDAVPQTLTPLIERQLEALEPDLRHVLEAASVIGLDFSAAELAAAQGKDVEDVEAECDSLVADGRFVHARGAAAWPDGTVSSRYRFVHSLHRQVLRDSLSAGRRSRLHAAVGERLRRAFAGREEVIAAELAMHFENGLDLRSAAHFFRVAGEASARRFSNVEAVGHFRRALELLDEVEFEGQGLLEIQTRLGFCAPLAAVSGYAATELQANLDRIAQLTDGIEDTPEMFPAILGLWSLHFVRADFDRTTAFGRRMLALSEYDESRVVRLQAHQSVGHSLFYRGEVVSAQRHYDLAMQGYDTAVHERQDYSVGDDPLVLVLACRALSSWFLGRCDEACESASLAVAQGERLAHPPSLALAWTYGAVLHQLRGDAMQAAKWSQQSLDITKAEGIPFWMELSRIVHGWAVVHGGSALGLATDGIDSIRSGIAGWEATGSALGLPHFLSLLAASLGRLGEIEEGLTLLEKASALAEQTGQELFRSEIESTRADLLFARAEEAGSSAELDAAHARYRQAAVEAESRGLQANALQAWLALADFSASRSEAERRLGEIVSGYPPNASHDLDLSRARDRLATAS